jgi:hypothetical protein
MGIFRRFAPANGSLKGSVLQSALSQRIIYIYDIRKKKFVKLQMKKAKSHILPRIHDQCHAKPESRIWPFQWP